MGMFAAVRRGFKKAGEKVKEGIKAAGRMIARTAAKISGKATMDEASQMYEKLKKESDSFKQKSEASYQDLSDRIQSAVNDINDWKQRNLKENLHRFAKAMVRIKPLLVNDDIALIEELDISLKKVESVQSFDALKTIDFDKPSFSRTMKNIFTLGIYGRKRAKETLYHVKDEAKVFEETQEKVKAELHRAENLALAFEAIRDVLNQIESVYGLVLNEIEAKSFRYATVALLNKTTGLKRSKLLTKQEQMQIRATMEATKLIRELIDKEFVAPKQQDVSQMKTFEKQMDKVAKAA
ncbi:hypothetical protein [Weissella confusa]|uniref:hypothetical protein n=1 Tax=Weissella confusa TaxID=1583 RepID=UPI00108051B5|nr:hypothetical protein [Weissella confusa]MBJ7628347.1 hypothetical protein [Weissella confusa]TGE50252.1 hypothetical protein C6P23_01050 [Weissella confusa]TGE54375.1 hypothetical protein C6P18_01055 [Weissella confusa]TGE61530.1 hypothetical protein C6P19_01045 [Weissella confusa]TGE62766.1 hypothetical protein C6P21_01055 [Weissella confusa]